MFVINTKVDKKIIHAFFVCLSILFVFFFNSMFFLLISIFLCSIRIYENLLVLIGFIVFSPFLLLIDFSNFKDYLLMIFLLVAISSFYENKEKEFLLVYSYILLLFIFFIYSFGEKIVYLSDIILFKERLFFVWNGDLVNSNLIGILVGFSAIGFFINKKYFFMLISLFIMLLTQSRSSLIFFLIFLTFSTEFSIRKFIFSIFSIFSLIFILYLSPVSERFLNGPGESGDERLKRIFLHSDTIIQSFPFGFNYNSYLSLSDIFGTIDNNYIYLYIRFGVIGVFSLFLLIFFFLKNKDDDFKYFRRGIFMALMVQGIFESTMYGNFFAWPILAICFNSFKSLRYS